MKFWNAPSKVCTDTFKTTPESQMLNCPSVTKPLSLPKLCLLIIVPINLGAYWSLFLSTIRMSVCEREREFWNFDITLYPEITSTSCQDFGYFVPRLDCNFVQDFTLTSYLDSTQYWQFTYTDFFPHYLQPWRTSYTKFNFVTSYQNRYPLL